MDVWGNMPDWPQGLQVTRNGPVAHIVLDRGDGRNPLSADIMTGLRDIARWLKTDISTHVVIVRGAPVFSAGADLRDPAMRSDHLSRLEQRQAILLGPDMCAAWEALEQITIAAIEGYCLGGALALAVACDWRICGASARLRLPEVPLNMNMSWQANPRITALIGPARAKKLIILGEDCPPEEALAWGLIDEVTRDGDTLAAAEKLATKVAALPPVPVRMSKQAVNAHAHALNYVSSFMDREQYALLTGSEESKAAIRATLGRNKQAKKGN